MNLDEVNRKAIANLLALPENKVCADCGSRDPRWGSTTFGVFICITCAGGHRKMDWRVKSSDLDKWSTDDVNKMKHTGNAKGKALYTTLLPPPHAFDQGKQHEAWLKDKYSKKHHPEVVVKEKSVPNMKLSTPPSSSTLPPPSTSTTSPHPQTAPARVKKDNEREVDLISIDVSAPPAVVRAQSSPNVLSSVPLNPNANSLESGSLKESIMSMYTTPIAPAAKPAPVPLTPAPPVAKVYPAPNYNVIVNKALSPTLNPYFNQPVIPAVPVQPNYNVRVGTPAPPPYGYTYPYSTVGSVPAGMPYYPYPPAAAPNKPPPTTTNYNPSFSSSSKLNDFSLL